MTTTGRLFFSSEPLEYCFPLVTVRQGLLGNKKMLKAEFLPPLFLGITLFKIRGSPHFSF